jgi:hypothetical protein
MTELARGTYRYARDGVPQAISEPWQLRQTPQGVALLGRREIGGESVLEVEAGFARARCTSLTAYWKRQHAPLARSVRYQLVGETLHWRSHGSDSTQIMPLPGGCVLFPLLRAAAGPLIRQLSQQPGWVVLPNINDSTGPPLLHPTLSQRQATTLDRDLALGDRFRYVGGEYAQTGADYWLDRHAIVQRYVWDAPHGRWDVHLEDYWVAKCFTGFA